MNPDEVIDLLSLISARDNRKVGQATVAVWFEDVGDLDFADCRDAVRQHFRESTDWLMPAHIRKSVRAMQEARIQASGLAVYQALKARDPETDEEYRAALKNILARIGQAGSPLPFKAIEAARDEDGGDGPSEVYREVRKDRDEKREAAVLAAARAEIDWSRHATCLTCKTLLDPDGSCFTCAATPATPTEENA